MGIWSLLPAAAAEALELLQLHSMDVAVVDNISPGMDGLDLARQIKEFCS